MTHREERQSGLSLNSEKVFDNPDWRTPYQHDCDRLLYSPYFRRLGGVTQVVSSQEGLTHIFHTRLTHTLKVTQIARRLAERLKEMAKNEKIEIDPDVAEAAALAHDLGHPPFGHTAEEKLNELVQKESGQDHEGFEGNAQSFRIITRLAIRMNNEKLDKNPLGLDLTRATLNAILKYPWRWENNGKKKKKFGAYTEDKDAFEFARKECDNDIRSVEADIMDLADDITYAIHDIEDFYKAGLIPLELFARHGTEQDKDIEDFLEYTYKKWEEKGLLIELDLPGNNKENTIKKLGAIIGRITKNFPADRYKGLPEEMALFSGNFTNRLLNNWFSQIGLLDDFKTKSGVKFKWLEVPLEVRMEIEVLKSLTWYYVIEGRSLASQQTGCQKIIECLFNWAFNYLNKEKIELKVFPEWVKYFVEKELEENKTSNKNKNKKQFFARTAADFVASLTEQQAYELYYRINGFSAGSILNPITA